MQFHEVLDQILALLQREGRVSYRALKRQFGSLPAKSTQKNTGPF